MAHTRAGIKEHHSPCDQSFGLTKDHHVQHHSLKWSVLPRKLQLFLVVAFLFTLGNSSNTFLLLRAKNLGFTPAMAIGLHATIIGIGLFPASFIAGQLWDRLGPAAAFYFGGGTGILAALGLMSVL
jgi:hypothetical protein